VGRLSEGSGYREEADALHPHGFVEGEGTSESSRKQAATQVPGCLHRPVASLALGDLPLDVFSEQGEVVVLFLVAAGLLQLEFVGIAVKRRTLDWPERVMEVYLQHCNDYELPSTVRNAMDTVAELRKEVRKRRELEQAQAAELYAAQVQQAQAMTPEVADSPSGAKRKWGDGDGLEVAPETSNKRQKNHAVDEHAAAATGQDSQNLKRDRENTSVLVSNIPATATQTKIRQYFKEYGHINSIATVQDANRDTQTAFIEFSTPDEAQSALLRNGKYFGEAQLSVGPGTDLTVFVTNYPPRIGPDDLRELFKDCGDIVSIRMPSLKANVRRRFCYITFRDRTASTKATQKHGSNLDGYSLSAMFSDPSRAKKREGAVEEGRELHITGLDTMASDDDVRAVFAKYGSVRRVNVPRNKAGKAHGTAYVEFETKAQAESAASELNTTKFRNSIMTVQISLPSTIKRAAASSNDRISASPAPHHDGEGDEAMSGVNGNTNVAPKGPSHEEIFARSIGLLDIPDTVNDARIKAIVEEIDGFMNLVLQPNHGGAKIEFADPASAGRAALRLDGYVLDGRKLRTGSLDELKHSKGETKSDKIQYGVGRKDKAKPTSKASVPAFAPSTVRRPVLGKGGARRGLGFVVQKGSSTPKSNGVSTGGDDDEQAKPMKSNADFKAMFLKGESAPRSEEPTQKP